MQRRIPPSARPSRRATRVFDSDHARRRNEGGAKDQGGTLSLIRPVARRRVAPFESGIKVALKVTPLLGRYPPRLGPPSVGGLHFPPAHPHQRCPNFRFDVCRRASTGSRRRSWRGAKSCLTLRVRSVSLLSHPAQNRPR